MNFKVGDKVIVTDDGYTISKEGWVGVIDSLTSRNAEVLFKEYPRNTLPVSLKDLRKYTKLDETLK